MDTTDIWGAHSRLGMSVKLLDLNTARGEFSGYGARFGNLDQTGDIIEPGAFRKTLADAAARQRENRSPFLIPLLFMHDPEKPIGYITVAREDSKGLYIEGRVDLENPLGKSVFSGMSNGYIAQFSIGYDSVRATRDTKGIRHLQEVRLWEISAITSGFAANVLANLDPVSVKSADQLRLVIERMMSVMTKDMRDWTSQRPMLSGGGAPARAPYQETADDAPPSRLEFVTERQFREAVDEWLAKRNSQAAFAQEQERRQAAFQKSVTVARDQRVCRGLATLAEQRSYLADYGHGPDGQQYRDESERVMKAYAAIYAKLDAGDD